MSVPLCCAVIVSGDLVLVFRMSCYHTNVVFQGTRERRHTEVSAVAKYDEHFCTTVVLTTVRV